MYWSPGGELSTTRQRFWWQRFTRIYPVHLIAILNTILLYTGTTLIHAMRRQYR